MQETTWRAWHEPVRGFRLLPERRSVHADGAGLPGRTAPPDGMHEPGHAPVRDGRANGAVQARNMHASRRPGKLSAQPHGPDKPHTRTT